MRLCCQIMNKKELTRLAILQVDSIVRWLEKENGQSCEHDREIAIAWCEELYKQLKTVRAVNEALHKKHMQHYIKEPFIFPELSPFRSSGRDMAKDL